jgi:hypothetical protein
MLSDHQLLKKVFAIIAAGYVEIFCNLVVILDVTGIISLGLSFRRILASECRRNSKGRFTHSMPRPCCSPGTPFVNSHMPCRAPAVLRQCRVLRESPHGSRKYLNCQSRSLTERLFCSVLLPLFSSSMTNVIWFRTGHLHLRVVCY